MKKSQISCIGGGHGLGRLLSALSVESNFQLTGIVTTSDNGGSSGRLRKEMNTIAWGDLRHCLSQLSTKMNTEQLLFEYRFDNCGTMSGHSLGNLMLLALDQLCVRPTDSIDVMRRFLGIDIKILPMSDVATRLMAKTKQQDILTGETMVESSEHVNIETLWLEPAVCTSSEVITSIEKSDLITLGPGSFLTSIMPTLLTNSVVDAINQSSAKLVLIANLDKDHSSIEQDKIDYNINLLNKIGLRSIDQIIWPNQQQSPKIKSACIRPYHLPADKFSRHRKLPLLKAIKDLLLNN